MQNKCLKNETAGKMASQPGALDGRLPELRAPRPGELPSGGLPGETKWNSSSSHSQTSFQLLARFKLFPGNYNLYVFLFFLRSQEEKQSWGSPELQKQDFTEIVSQTDWRLQATEKSFH